MRSEREEIIEAIRQRLRSHRELIIKRMCGVWPEITNDDNIADEADRDIAALVEFRRTEKVLHQIREGTFGRCGMCNGQIAGERLEVLPFATTGIQCQLKETSKSCDDETD